MNTNKKDPAFLFYPADASDDTQFMNRLERGAYFDLLKGQKLYGGYTTVQLRKILGKDYEEVWPALELVLIKEGDFYYIGWLRESILKRQAFSAKQKEKIEKRWNNHGNTAVLPKKENGNGNVIENIIEIKNENEKGGVGESEIFEDSGFKKQKKEKIDNPFITDCKEIFFEFYNSIGIRYVWQPKDNKGLGGIISQIKTLLKDKYGGNDPPAEEVKNTIRVLLKNLPEWYKKNNCEVQVINSNLNSIRQQIKNGQSKQATANRTDEILNKYYR